MKRIILFLPISILLLTIVEACKHGSKETPLKDFPTDSINVFARLSPNEVWHSGRHTYGTDSTIGNTIHYRVATDSSQIHMNYDITLLELNPKITENLLSFIHTGLLVWGFVNEEDEIPTFDVKVMSDKGFSQRDILKKMLDWESLLFYKDLPSLSNYENGYFIDFAIYPVYIDENYVTYNLYYEYYTGGDHPNDIFFLRTYDRQTGKSVNLEDLVKPDMIKKFRQQAVLHMASGYPIFSLVNSVEAYLDSINRWLGITETEQKRITVDNYPVNNPGIHETGLVITYATYDLTPGCYGCPIILIPFDEIRECLKEPFCNYKTDASKLVANKGITLCKR